MRVILKDKIALIYTGAHYVEARDGAAVVMKVSEVIAVPPEQA